MATLQPLHLVGDYFASSLESSGYPSCCLCWRMWVVWWRREYNMLGRLTNIHSDTGQRNLNLLNQGLTLNIIRWWQCSFRISDDDDNDEDVTIEASSSVRNNILTIVATLGTLSAFFALGALLFTAWEVWTSLCCHLNKCLVVGLVIFWCILLLFHNLNNNRLWWFNPWYCWKWWV